MFRMGDFYETFDDDAELCSRELGIALTSRPMGKGEGRIPLAGVPHHQLERYLERLVSGGHRVAIAEQVSEPGQGLVERRILRVVTPGTVESGALLPSGAHNWLAAAAPGPADPRGAARWVLAACDVTTGELELQLLGADELAGEWARLAPRELLIPDGERSLPATQLPEGVLITRRPARRF
ncbi:MAG: DNA mismatch repair protein MutS, partial [Chloroflexi bacterium]|nr:DNA mismatch repair protein MutS [Chloroflexota bacterium]